MRRRLPIPTIYSTTVGSGIGAVDADDAEEVEEQDSSSELIDEEDEDFARGGQGAPEGK